MKYSFGKICCNLDIEKMETGRFLGLTSQAAYTTHQEL